MKILVIGGTRFFGKRLVHLLLDDGHEVTVLSRGHALDDFGNKVQRLTADRTDAKDLSKAVEGLQYDIVVDQVCMTASDARSAVEIFKNKTAFYIMTSTLSVYGAGGSQPETAFDATKYVPRTPKGPAESYAEGKRAAENVFATSSAFPCAFARFPVVVGDDDYTERLLGQVRKIKNDEPIYYPNIDADFCFITSEDAARALNWLVKTRKTGPYNFSSETFKLKDLISLIEQKTHHKAKLLGDPSEKDWSPFGVRDNWSLNTEKARSEGFTCKPNKDWLPDLIERLNG